MSWSYEYDCPCGSSGMVSEQGMSEEKWFLCMECGRDTRLFGLMYSDITGDDGIDYYVWEASQGRSVA